MPYWLVKLQEQPPPPTTETIKQDTPTGAEAIVREEKMAQSRSASPARASRTISSADAAAAAQSCLSRKLATTPELSERLKAASAARRRLLMPRTTASDTEGIKEIKHNQSAMSQAWGDLRLRPPSIAISLCSAINTTSPSASVGKVTRCNTSCVFFPDSFISRRRPLNRPLNLQVCFRDSSRFDDPTIL